MGQIKISDLTPKGAPLSDTDLFVIAQETSDDYESRSITGAEIIESAQEGMQPTLVSGTNIKTVNSTSLVGSGNVEVQPTLVSGTNIKTINGNSLLGSGDLVVGGGGGLTIGTTAITSGTVGRILFEGTGNVLQESANLFWDNTNNRLGINNASPTQSLDISGAMRIVTTGNYPISLSRGSTSGVAQQVSNSGTTTYFGTDSTGGGFLFTGGLQYASFFGNGGNFPTQFGTNGATRMTIFNDGNIGVNTTTNAGFKLDVNGTARVSGNLTLNGGSLLMNNNNIYVVRGTGSATDGMEIRALSSGTDAVKVTTSSVSISSAGGLTYQASAQLAVDSTTKGFLPPRMTTTQRNAIASPASGLIVYDTTDNKHYGYNGTAWTAFY